MNGPWETRIDKFAKGETDKERFRRTQHTQQIYEACCVREVLGLGPRRGEKKRFRNLQAANVTEAIVDILYLIKNAPAAESDSAFDAGKRCGNSRMAAMMQSMVGRKA